jgi:hypothetical protein
MATSRRREAEVGASAGSSRKRPRANVERHGRREGGRTERYMNKRGERDSDRYQRSIGGEGVARENPMLHPGWSLSCARTPLGGCGPGLFSLYREEEGGDRKKRR